MIIYRNGPYQLQVRYPLPHPLGRCGERGKSTAGILLPLFLHKYTQLNYALTTRGSHVRGQHKPEEVSSVRSFGARIEGANNEESTSEHGTLATADRDPPHRPW